MNHKHDWHINDNMDYECHKCFRLRDYYNWDAEDCSVADKIPPRVEDVYPCDYAHKTEDQLRQILSNGNRDSGRSRY